MAENLTFADFSVASTRPEDIYRIGQLQQTGSVQDMASAFSYDLAYPPTVEDIGQLMSSVGPDKDLQRNIQGVKDVIGDDQAAVDVARDWVLRSGLLIPVERPFMTTEAEERDVSLVVISGGVRNWMYRRAERLKELANSKNIGHILLVAGQRPMGTGEGTDVEEGMKEIDYMRLVIAEHLSSIGVALSVEQVDATSGDGVMDAAAKRAREIIDEHSRVALVSNAGAWVQNAGQLRRAFRNNFGEEFDRDGQQVLVVSDSFPLGVTATEPTATHQNTFSAAGQILRNTQELLRHYA